MKKKEIGTAPSSGLESREGIAAAGESLWRVYIRRFKKHTLGKVGGGILIVLYFFALFADFFSPYDMRWTDKQKSYQAPTGVVWTYNDGTRKVFRPFTYEKWLVNVSYRQFGVVPEYTLRAISIEPRAGRPELRSVVIDRDPSARKEGILASVANHYGLSISDEAIQRLSREVDSLEKSGLKDQTIVFTIGTRVVAGKEYPLQLYLSKGNKNFLKFFFKGTPYKFWGLFETNTHFFGSPTGGYFPLGTDQFGRDIFTRLLHGSRISLSVGLVGALITFSLGLLFGGIAGYFGGAVDTVMMRISELMMSFPSIYLLFILRAIFPPNLNSVQVYLLIIAILALIGWASLARIIRGMVLALKNEDYVLSAKIMGLSNLKIIIRHILPNTLSFVIIQATITIPGYILGESALSLLGLGITEPQSSWGLMLSVARNFRVMRDFPWVLVPGFAIFIAIMAWNFFGDGIRDAVDPRSKH